MEIKNQNPKPLPLFHGSKKEIMQQAAALTLSYRQSIINVEGQQQQMLDRFIKLQVFIEAQMETIKSYLEVLSNMNFIKQIAKEQQPKEPAQENPT